MIADKFTEEQQQEAQDRYEEAMIDQSVTKALKHERKHRRDISRLKKHAEKCLFELNPQGYCYAIASLRKLYKQPVLDDGALLALYNTSISTMVQAIKDAQSKHSIQ